MQAGLGAPAAAQQPGVVAAGTGIGLQLVHFGAAAQQRRAIAGVGGVGGDHVIGGQAVGEQRHPAAIAVHVRQGGGEFVPGDKVAGLDQNLAQGALPQQAAELVAHQTLGGALGLVRRVEQQRGRRLDLAAVGGAENVLEMRDILLVTVGKTIQALAPGHQLLPQPVGVDPGTAAQGPQAHADVALPVGVEGGAGFRHDRPAGIDVQVAEIGFRVDAEIVLGKVTPADDGPFAVHDPGLVVHAMVQPGGVVKPLNKMLVAAPERVEQADLHIRVGVQRRPFHVPAELVGVVEQQPHLDAPAGGFQGPVDQQLANPVVLPDVVLQVQGSLRQAGGGRAQHERFFAVRDQAKMGVLDVLAGGAVPGPLGVVTHQRLRLSRISRSSRMSSGTSGVGGGSTGAASSSLRLTRLSPRTRKNTAQATITKLITLLIKTP